MALEFESRKLKQRFTTSTFSISSNLTLTVELRDEEFTGRGECEPHECDSELAQSVIESVEKSRDIIEGGLDRRGLNNIFPAGPARNALDCAFWDLECKRTGRRAWEIAGVSIAASSTIETAYTVSLGTAEEMATQAYENRGRPLLKLKLGKDNSLELVKVVRGAAPNSRFIVDVNGAWDIDELNGVADPLSDLGVELIEQPLPTESDDQLSAYVGSVPICADESCLDMNSLLTLNEKYSFINIKLDKTGGLTEALQLAEAARSRSLGIMVGCMNGTSLAIAPAMVVAALADYCDLDGPILLEQDRVPGLIYQESSICLPTPEIWG